MKQNNYLQCLRCFAGTVKDINLNLLKNPRFYQDLRSILMNIWSDVQHRHSNLLGF